MVGWLVVVWWWLVVGGGVVVGGWWGWVVGSWELVGFDLFVIVLVVVLLVWSFIAHEYVFNYRIYGRCLNSKQIQY
jgi:hypothetical protein